MVPNGFDPTCFLYDGPYLLTRKYDFTYLNVIYKDYILKIHDLELGKQRSKISQKFRFEYNLHLKETRNSHKK